MLIQAEPLSVTDPEIYDVINAESLREESHIELIASENYASPSVMEAQGSLLTNKYAEGYPGRRYYGGCDYVDKAEQLAINRACELFDCDYANVQPHSGAQANAAIYMALVRPGDIVMGMSLADGGHLTHGHRANFSGKHYKVVSYGVDPVSGLIDYEAMEQLAMEHRPRLLIGGFSAYSRIVDWERMRAVADSVGAWFWVDMAHVAGLVAAGLYTSPIPYAHVVTSTTHKTLRGPRGGLILSSGQPQDLTRKLNASVFPGIQGGPLMHVVAAKAVAFQEALTAEFKDYQRKVIENARAMASVFLERRFKVVSGGTDNHLFLLDLSSNHITGKDAENALGRANITVNKNAIPGDSQPATVTSGLRIGSPASTTRGFGKKEMIEVANWMADILDSMQMGHDLDALLVRIRGQVEGLCEDYPVYRKPGTKNEPSGM